MVGSRKWRIAIVEVEWEDEEEGVRFVSRYKTYRCLHIITISSIYVQIPLSIWYCIVPRWTWDYDGVFFSLKLYLFQSQ